MERPSAGNGIAGGLRELNRLRLCETMRGENETVFACSRRFAVIAEPSAAAEDDDWRYETVCGAGPV